MIAQSRRAFLRGGLALLAAPAIVRASNLMPIKARQRAYLWHDLPYDEIQRDIQAMHVALVREISAVAQVPARFLLCIPGDSHLLADAARSQATNLDLTILRTRPSLLHAP